MNTGFRLVHRTGIAIVVAAAGVAAVVVALVQRANGAKSTSLTERPTPVSTIRAENASYRPTRVYVGTLEPWNAANIGPQFVAAYVETVVVRPGAVVHRGDVLATLDCRDVHSTTAAVEARARALDAQQQALANQVKRLDGLRERGYVSTDDVEQKTAASLAETEQLAAERAHLSSMSLQVADCVLRAPFDGEVTERAIDPGAFVRPGAAIVSIVDRHIVRFAADVPEDDFGVVAEGKPVRIHVDPVGRDFDGVVTRRTSSADYATRTVHFEVDLPNADDSLPVRVTAGSTLEVGDPMPVAAIPIRAASVRNGKATVFAVDGAKARGRTVALLGERGDVLFVDPVLAGATIVTEGRTILVDGDRVADRPESATGSAAP